MTVETLLELEGITKRFPGVVANDAVDLTVGAGEILGILGENGAGKSTLMNIISGMDAPDSGRISVAGESVAFGSCRDAIDRGIGMVHQHFMLVPTLTVAENVLLGDRRAGSGRRARRRTADRIRNLGGRLGLAVDPDARVADLSVGERQRVEIIKVLHRGARILILDEPTAVLSKPESEGLFGAIRSLAESGVAVILISHKFDDIFDVCGRVVVMRQGRVAGTLQVADATREGLVQLMVGENVTPPQRRDHETGKTMLSVEALAVTRDDGAAVLRDVTFDLSAGEILALAGVEGNGQRELAEALTGMRTPAAGRIVIDGRPTSRSSARGRRRLGMAHVPENRNETGILAPLSLTENFLLSHYFRHPYNRRGWIRRKAAAREADQSVATFDIRAAGATATIGALSGGNQQKAVLAREMSGDPAILVAAHPTRGLDVRTISFVQRQLLDKRDAGMAILLISADLAEIWQIADRVMVAAGGRIIGPMPVNEVDLHKVSAWMSGS